MSKALFCFLLFASFKSDCQLEKTICDCGQLNKIDKKIPMLSLNDAHLFLLMFRKECLNNAEFMEYSNEIMFKLMLNEPDVFLKAITWKNDEVNVEIVLHEIANPISDSIDLNKVKKKIANSTISSSVKKQVLLSLDKAIN